MEKDFLEIVNHSLVFQRQVAKWVSLKRESASQEERHDGEVLGSLHLENLDGLFMSS